VLQKYAKIKGADGIYPPSGVFSHLEDQSFFSRLPPGEGFAAVVERHPALRTVLESQKLPPLQCIKGSAVESVGNR